MEQTYAIEIVQTSDVDNTPLTGSETVIELTDAGIIGLDALCRLCANRSDHLIPIYEGEGLKYQLEFKINTHLPFSVEKTESMPTHCCYQCASTLLTWHELVETSSEADRRLRALQQDAVVHLSQKISSYETIGVAEGDDANSHDPTSSGQDGRFQETSTTHHPDLDSHLASREESANNIKYIRIRTAPIIKKENPDEHHYNVKLVKITGEGEIKPPLNDMTIPPIFLCPICEVTFSTNDVFARHLRSHASLDQVKVVLAENADACSNNEVDELWDARQKDASLLVDCEKELNFNIIMPKPKAGQKSFLSHFKCPLCADRFLTKDQWVTHNTTHPLIFTCDECTSRFCHERYLMFHQLDSHSTYKVCDYCSMSFENEDLLVKHLYKHNICDICGQHFKSIAGLRCHRRMHPNVENKTSQYQCAKCPKSFQSKSGLLHHKQQIHSTSTGFKCNLCEMSFQNQNLLKYHILNHDTAKNLSCEICFKVFNRISNLNAHVATHINDTYCKVCCCSFISQFRLESHLSKHTDTEIAEAEFEPKTVQCPFKQCTVALPSRLRLYEHKKSHLDIIEYPCIDCYRKFKTESQLATHRKIHHQFDTDCRTCGKHFSTLKTLREHVRMHTGEKPFACSVCAAEFRCQSSLVAHRSIHSTERRYMCGICKRTFARANYLKEHLRTHRKERPFKCKYCTKSFIQSNVLKTHISLRHQSCWVCKQIVGNTTLMRVHLLKEHNTKLEHKPRTRN